MANPPKPWKVEYAKSSRSSCKTCKTPIEKETLRLGKMVQATQFDGFMPVNFSPFLSQHYENRSLMFIDKALTPFFSRSFLLTMWVLCFSSIFMFRTCASTFSSSSLFYKPKILMCAFYPCTCTKTCFMVLSRRFCFSV